MRPVAPPTRASGRCPASWSRRSGQDLHQVADVQARRGRVEAAVERDRAGRECGRGSVVASVACAIRPRQCRSSRTAARVAASRHPIGPVGHVLIFAYAAGAAGRADRAARRRPRTATDAPAPAPPTPVRGPLHTRCRATRSPANSRRRPAGSQPVGPVVRPGHAERRGQPGRPAREVAPARAVGRRACTRGKPVDHLAGAQQHRRRRARSTPLTTLRHQCMP